MNEKYKQDFFRAGQLAKEVRAYGLSLIKKGASYNETIDKIRAKIHTLGAEPAFPPQIALNDTAAHFLPEPGTDIIFQEDVVKLDIGICYQGAIGDCAATVDLSGKYQKLILATEEALLAAENSLQVGMPVREIGRIIEEKILLHGFTPIRNLSGHGLGFYQIHTSPHIPNYHDRSTAILKPGMTFAIEPFATNGKGLIFETENPTIFVLTATASSYKNPTPLVQRMLSFRGLPFALHDLVEVCSLKLVKTEIAHLKKQGLLAEYGPLIEEEGGMVAQAENSVLIDEKGKVFITTR
ncbi:MAG TPA: M24 family metallopeptidase [Chlamydiales bacterium]|nr:M24 family metallopeptidase [Chlamydiales bacterium]